jgi:predicted P-loop ATPase
MLILEGAQGIGKSTLVRYLAPRAEWHAAGVLDVGHKDGVADLAGKFIYEMEELQTFRRANDVDALKAFLSRVTDRVRLSYRRDSADYARRAVFVGTTNKKQYLPGDDGPQRRFWPVECAGRIDTDWFRTSNAQLWAEALWAAVLLDEAPALDSAVASVAEAEQTQRSHTPEEHPWHQALVKLWDDPEYRDPWPQRLTSHDALSTVGVSTDKQTRAQEQQIAEVLKSLGYRRERLQVGGRRSWYWTRGPGDDAPR